MNIDEKQLAQKPKKIGKIDGKDVFSAVLKGGYNMIVTKDGSKTETLGVGSHIAIARAAAERIAARTSRNVEWTELSKSEWLPPQTYAHLVDKYEEETNQIRTMQGY